MKRRLKNTDTVKDSTKVISDSPLIDALLRDLSVSVAIVSVPDFRFEFANRAYGAFCGVPHERLIHRAPSDFNLDETERHLDQICRERKPVIFKESEIIFGENEDATYWDIEYKPAFDDDGAIDKVIISAVDVSEQVNRRREIEKEEQHFRTLVDHLSKLAWMADSESRLFWFNKSWYMYTGASLDEMKGDGWLKLVHPDHLERLSQKIEDARSTGHPWEDVFPLKGEGGDFRWFLCRAEPVRARDGSIVRWVGANTDITRQRETEEALRESESHFRTLADNISQLAWMADPAGNIFWFNKRWFDYTGTTPDYMERGGWAKVQHPEHVDRVVKSLQRSWDTGEPWEDTFPLRGKGGQYRWFLSRALPIRNERGEIVRWFGTNTDITDNKLLEERLMQERELLLAIIDSMPVMVSIYDPNINEVVLNKAVEKITGWTAADIQRKSIMELAYPDPVYRKKVADFMQSLKPGFMDIQMTSKSGKLIDTTWANVKIPDGRHVGIGIDITERKQMEEEIMKANKKLTHKNLRLKKLNELMESLLYMAAHDLKSPVSNMQLMLNLVEKQNIPFEKINYISNFHRMIERLVRVIDGLSEIIQTQQLEEANISEINLEEIVQEIQADNAVLLENMDADIRYDFSDALTISYIKTFIYSILKNLISNAIKYKHPDRKLMLEITARREEGYILIKIKDNGIGMNLQRIRKHLFQPFKRFTTVSSGAGIGLYIVKSLIEKNQGFIKVESEPEKGSVFYCYLREYKRPV